MSDVATYFDRDQIDSIVFDAAESHAQSMVIALEQAVLDLLLGKSTINFNVANEG